MDYATRSSSALSQLVVAQQNATMKTFHDFQSGVTGVSLPVSFADLCNAVPQAYQQLIQAGAEIYAEAFPTKAQGIVSEPTNYYKMSVLALLLSDIVKIYTAEGGVLKSFYATLSEKHIRQCDANGILDLPAEKKEKFYDRYFGTGHLDGDYLWKKKIPKSDKDTVPVIKLTIGHNTKTQTYKPSINAVDVDLRSSLIFPMTTWLACANQFAQLLDNNICYVLAGGHSGYYTRNVNAMSAIHSAEQIQQMQFYMNNIGMPDLGVVQAMRLGSSIQSMGIRHFDIGDIDSMAIYQGIQAVPPAIMKSLAEEVNVDISQTRKHLIDMSSSMDDFAKQAILLKLLESDMMADRLKSLNVTEDWLQNATTAEIAQAFPTVIAHSYDSVLYELLSNNELLGNVANLEGLKKKPSRWGNPVPVQINIHDRKSVLKVLYGDKPVRVIYRNKKGGTTPLVCTKNINLLNQFIGKDKREHWESESERIKGAAEYVRQACELRGLPMEQSNMPADLITGICHSWGIGTVVTQGESTVMANEVYNRLTRASERSAELRQDFNTSHPMSSDDVMVRCLDALTQDDYIRRLNVNRIIQMFVLG